jgi:two-component system cell cycle sensor histidine kinase/response regulator CckA
MSDPHAQSDEPIAPDSRGENAGRADGAGPLETMSADELRAALRRLQAKLEDDEQALRCARVELGEVRSREELMRGIFENMPDAYFRADRDGRFLLVNPCAARQWGYDSTSEMIGLPAEQLYADPSDRQAMLRQLRDERRVDDYVARARRKDGSTFWITLSVQLLRDEHGAVCGTEGFVRDISLRKRAEEALRESERRLRDITSSMADWVWEVDARGVYTYSSEKGLELFGPLRGDVTGKTPFDLMPPDEAARVASIFAGLVARKAPIKDLENWNIGRNGDRICLLTNGVPVLDETGELLGYRGVDKDITERKRAEEEIARSHDLLVNLARLVPGVIYQYLLRPDGRSAFPYSSPGMNDIYEVTPEEAREDATPVFGRLHPEDYPKVAGAIAESARTLETFRCEFRVVLPRQGLRWRWSQAHPERTADGGTLWHGIILDVTERKQAEAEKATLEEQLRQAQKMESVGRLAGGVAHDFNNMLGVILGHAELAIDQVDPSEPIRADLEQIHLAARRSADLTRQLLAFARRQTIAPQVLDLSQTVTGMISMLQRLIGEHIRLIWLPTPDLWKVKVDPSQIDQLLANLCVNARDAISGVGRVTIEMANATFDEEYCALHAGFVPGDYVRVTVGDDGCGMDKETLSHLFEPFFTTKAMGKGTGLGLATVYGITRQNHGFINVYSEPGHGTTMTVYIPRYAGDGERASEERRSPSALRGTETILLVEDEPAMLSMATIVLEGLGYKVVAAGSAYEAIRVAGDQASEIGLLVTDVIMPDMNGRDLAARLLARNPHMKHLFMSGYTADVIARQGVLDEGVPFIQKPFSREALATKVREALDRH